MDTNNKFPQVMVNNTLPSTATVSVLEKSAANTPIVPIKAFDADRDSKFLCLNKVYHLIITNEEVCI